MYIILKCSIIQIDLLYCDESRWDNKLQVLATRQVQAQESNMYSALELTVS